MGIPQYLFTSAQVNMNLVHTLRAVYLSIVHTLRAVYLPNIVHTPRAVYLHILLTYFSRVSHFLSHLSLVSLSLASPQACKTASDGGPGTMGCRSFTMVEEIDLS
jgi:hypothetical protein